MCEFCLDPNTNRRRNRDSFHADFAGFFSSQAIEAAVRQAAANSNAASSSSSKKDGQPGDEQGNDDDDADSDGT